VLQRLGVELPVVQAGMGGGLAGHQLAAAVSAAGGLGTIGILAPAGLHGEIVAAGRLSDRPLAVNVLLPSLARVGPVTSVSAPGHRPRANHTHSATRSVELWWSGEGAGSVGS